MNKKVAGAMVYIKAEVERKRIVEGALKVAMTKYLASDAFEIVKARCFLEGFKNLWDLVTEAFPDYDFASIIPDEGEAEAEEG